LAPIVLCVNQQLLYGSCLLGTDVVAHVRSRPVIVIISHLRLILRARCEQYLSRTQLTDTSLVECFISWREIKPSQQSMNKKLL